MSHFYREQWINSPLIEVFEFFSQAKNLESITPDFLNFKILTPEPIVMREGLLIDYQLRLRGIPFRWQSEISTWDPPYCFVDDQVKGPYREWHHRHTFKEEGEGTCVIDDVRYRIWGGSWVDRLLVRPEVERIFNYRREKLAAYFAD